MSLLFTRLDMSGEIQVPVFVEPPEIGQLSTVASRRPDYRCVSVLCKSFLTDWSVSSLAMMCTPYSHATIPLVE